MNYLTRNETVVTNNLYIVDNTIYNALAKNLRNDERIKRQKKKAQKKANKAKKES